MPAHHTVLMLTAVLISMITPWVATASPPFEAPTASLLVSGLQGATGSTVGPGGDLYVTEALTGKISRVDPKTGEIETFATGLPTRVGRIGGAMDVAFIGQTAYVLVTLVGPDVGGSGIVGIYRMDGPNSFTVIADIGAFAVQNPTGHAVFRPHRRPVRARSLPRGFPGHRRAPQPGPARHPRRRSYRVRDVRQYRPDRTRGVGQHGIYGGGGPSPAPA